MKMKKIFVLGLTVLILSFGFISCSDGSDDSGQTVTFINNSTSLVTITMINFETFEEETSWTPSKFTIDVGQTKTTHNANVQDESTFGFSLTPQGTISNNNSWPNITYTITN